MNGAACDEDISTYVVKTEITSSKNIMFNLTLITYCYIRCIYSSGVTAIITSIYQCLSSHTGSKNISSRRTINICIGSTFYFCCAANIKICVCRQNT